jgi:hypothetical protein
MCLGLRRRRDDRFLRAKDLDPLKDGLAVWNQVFAGVVGAPAQSFPTPPYTTLATNPESREKPFLYVDSKNHFKVFVPDVQFNSSGTTWSGGQTAGHSISIDDFFIAKPTDSFQTINKALARGKNLIFTPGIYNVGRTIEVKRPDTIVLGMGLATIVPQHSVVPMKVADVKGVEISDLIFDAGPVNSPVLLQVGTKHASNGHAREHNHWSDSADPNALQDVYFRIGGANVGKATVSLEVNADNVILDNVWAWRADHGTGVGWTSKTADTGLIVNGDNVVATGLFVEHYQKDETIWSGQNGKIIFFQNEMPYDPPSQAAWTQRDGTLGYPAIGVTNNVKTFKAWGMGSYSFFNQGVAISSANAFVVPTKLAAGSLQDLLTIFLSTSGFGGIQNVRRSSRIGASSSRSPHRARSRPSSATRTAAGSCWPASSRVARSPRTRNGWRSTTSSRDVARWSSTTSGSSSPPGRRSSPREGRGAGSRRRRGWPSSP